MDSKNEATRETFARLQEVDDRIYELESLIDGVPDDSTEDAENLADWEGELGRKTEERFILVKRIADIRKGEI